VPQWYFLGTVNTSWREQQGTQAYGIPVWDINRSEHLVLLPLLLLHQHNTVKEVESTDKADTIWFLGANIANADLMPPNHACSHCRRLSCNWSITMTVSLIIDYS